MSTETKEAKPKIPRQENPKISLEERKTSFKEIHKGFDLETAKLEAKRCLQCKKPPCKDKGCPLHNRIPEWIKLIEDGKIMEAAALSRTTSNLPFVCGRVCPQEWLCEGACVVGVRDKPVAIGALERFCNDYAIAKGNLPLAEMKPKTGKKIAVIGSGPSGLAVAEQLTANGHEVVVYERLPKAGGVLVYGIPTFKLPRKVVDEHTNRLRQLGVKFECGKKIDSVGTLLKDGFNAVFIGIGASKGTSPNIEGIKLPGIIQSTDYLLRSNIAKEDLPKEMLEPIDVKSSCVTVFGGGNTAIDCLKTAIRKGANRVLCIYRRDEANMPASKKEIAEAKEEGVEFQFLTAPVRFIPDKHGKFAEVEYIKMELGEADASGRRKPVPIKGSNYIEACSLAVLAFGYEVEQDIVNNLPELKIDKYCNILINKETGGTTIKGVFAAGDCAHGADLVVTAVAEARKAAEGIHRYLTGETWEKLGYVSSE